MLLLLETIIYCICRHILQCVMKKIPTIVVVMLQTCINFVQNLLPVKDTAVEVSVPTSSEQKLQPSSSVSSLLSESVPAASERRRCRLSGDHSTRESSPGSERSSRGGPPVTERMLRDRAVPAADHVDDRSTRESSPVSERDSRGGERTLRERMASVSDRGAAKDRARLKRDANGTVSSSASTCSEDSELRINDFLGKTNDWQW